ncbi:palmitoleoyl-protein carboxylesterase notum1a-like [Clytia hemisphaerica]|uniref:Uncharacterized protein n=2 Tax=Clytia hemisphaerica TaxID=252671 RepID=A0A7M5XAB7_9CNID
MYGQLLLTTCIALCVQSTLSYPRNCMFAGDFVKCMRMDLRENGMDRYFLKGHNAPTCNDGSSAGYYFRSNPESSEWIIYLEGGWFCSEPKECFRRTVEKGFPTVTSSNSWKAKRMGDGLLSSVESENKEFWKANHVFIPYCSSDFWIGDTIADGVGDTKIAFHGSRIVTDVVKDLLSKGLKDADRLILAGSSAGGIGVLQNIDRVSNLISSHVNKKVDVRGLVDSAWVLDVPPVPGCEDCNPNLVFKKAIEYWNATLHTSCSQAYTEEKQKCLFAANVFKYIQRPIFVFQWLMDTVQIMTENSYQMNFDNKYLKSLGIRMRNSIHGSIDKTKDGVFAASCASHTGLATTSPMYSITIKDSTLNHALSCWLGSSKITSSCKKRLMDKCTGLHCHTNCPITSHPVSGLEIHLPSKKKEREKTDFMQLDDRAKYFLELLRQMPRSDSSSRQIKG